MRHHAPEDGSPMRLFRAIAKAVLKNVGNFASGLVGVPIAGDIIVDAWENWEKQTDERQRKAEIEALARQAVKDALPEAWRAIREEAAALPAGQRQQLAAYLTQVPASIRRSLRRPADHTGTTIPPGVGLRKASDLLRLLPAK